MSLKLRLFAMLAMVLATFAVSLVVTQKSINNLQKAIADTLDEVTEFTAHEVTLLDLLNELQFEVVQVQQFLTDVSATRGQDGLDDGFEESEKHAQAFRAALAKAKDVAKQAEMPELQKLLDDMGKDFEPYYAGGKEMAQAYVDNGPKAGNKFMATFDETAEKIHGEAEAGMVMIRQQVKDNAALLRTHAQGNVDDASEALRFLLILGIGSIVAAAAVGLWVTAQIVRPLRGLEEAMKAIAGGQTGHALPARTGMVEIDDMTASLTSLRETADEAFRQGQVLEQMSARVMVAGGPDFKINYLNKASREMLAGFQAHLPVPVDQILGQSVDIFHKHPAAQRAILQDPSRLPHTALIPLGNDIIELNISALSDRQGAYIGPLLTWTVVTEKVRMADTFESVVGTVLNTVKEAIGAIHDTANSSATRQEAGTTRSVGVADAAQETTRRVQSLAAAVEEMAASISEIARQVSNANQVSNEAVEDVDSAATQIKLLSDAIQQVGQVVGMISDVASQTNLLALNATIEAARAGEAGKGFAVVANEVKSLANQTAKATEEITSRISAIQEQTRVAVGAFERVRGGISSVNSIATSIAAAIEEQSAVTDDITRNVTGVSDEMGVVSSSIADVTLASLRSGAGAIEVLWQAESLQNASEELDQQTQKFLGMIRQ